jgi:predicted dehydrogenase
LTTADRPVGVGVLGCGQISRAYLTTLSAVPSVRVVACADISQERADARAKEFAIPRAYGPADLLADRDVELVVNLTWARAHLESSLAAVAAGKAVFTEKAMATSFTDATGLVDATRGARVRLGVAPGTFLGGGLQTARAAIDDGLIGTPIAATAIFLSAGPDEYVWDPEPFYAAGGGPLFDMGPYYLSSFVNLLGPGARVSASARRSATERHLTVGRRAGETIPVEVPTHASATIEFESGAVGTLVTSWDARATKNQRSIEIHGTEGSIHVPDPNDLAGPIRVSRAGDEEWHELPLRDVPSDGARWWGIGVVEMVGAMVADRPHRASAELGLHVMEIMQAVYDSSSSGRFVDLTTTVDRPPLLPEGWNGSKPDGG